MTNIKVKVKDGCENFFLGRILSADKIIVDLVDGGSMVKYKLHIKHISGESSCYLYYPDDHVLKLIGKELAFISGNYNENNIRDILHIFIDN
ncbi:hypothetical protein [Serratia liquefaciens]|jgi:hypothetical protein|uniref:hypothetical protein n=1 Tax=Serratia liquefaciens TaxID=614 RepID=UPI0021B70C06|nr:hypothetical protein [Serratia liquefaciens]